MELVNGALKEKKLNLTDLSPELQEEAASLQELIKTYNVACDEYEKEKDDNPNTVKKLDEQEDFIAAADKELAEKINAFANTKAAEAAATEAATKAAEEAAATEAATKAAEEAAATEAATKAAEEAAATEAATKAAEEAAAAAGTEKKSDGSAWLFVGLAVIVGVMTLGAVNILKKKA